jgi:hypothetical protein
MSSDVQEMMAAILIMLVALGALLALGTFAYQFFCLPYRRQERAQRFVELLETELGQGRAPEPAILRLAQCRDASLSVRFFVLAAWLEQGLKLDEALDKVPRFLPAGVTAILQTGCRLGDLRRVLPACRYQLQAAGDQVRKARRYFTASLIIFFPILAGLCFVISTFVIPKFNAIGAEMMGTLPANWAIIHIDLLVWLALMPVILLGIILTTLAAGPRIRLFLLRWLSPVFIDRLLNWTPWNNRRARRDFSLTLALLLDAGVPEDQALRHAGAATGSHFFGSLAQRAADKLREGTNFLDALAQIDPAGELKWRWQVAAHTHVPFQQALEGWHETLNVRAVKAEQSAASLATTFLVLLNGLVVGAVVVGVFQFLTTIIEETALW